MAKPIPGLDVPVINSAGQMNQAWFEYFQGLQALVKVLATPVTPTNTSASSLIGNPTGSPAVASEISLGAGLAFSGTSLKTNLSSLTNSLGADVALNNTANFFDGPSVAQGTTGTWFVSGNVQLIDTGTAPAIIRCILWDGTTVVDSTVIRTTNIVNGSQAVLSGLITSPAGNLRISCKDVTATTGKILFNESGSSKDCTITAVRLA